jgi:hypothetical protein
LDTLALLCNLHADGPATLHRLRRAGFESVAALGSLDPAGLAAELGWSERAAERFLREAVLLRERVECADDDAPAERADADTNDAQDEVVELESTLLDELDGEAAEEESEPDEPDEGGDDEEAFPEELAAAAEPPAERVEAVLGAWRELDRVAPPAAPAAFVIPRPSPPPDLDLAAARVPELSPALVARLGELGIHSVRQLLARGELDLARAIPLAFTRLAHLRHGARRALAQAPSVPGAEVTVRAFQTFPAPPSEPFETAGPFA